MSNASARRRFESAWRLANDPGTTAGERKAAQAAMDRMSAKYDTSGWVASLNGQARQERQQSQQRAQPPPRQKQQQQQRQAGSTGRQQNNQQSAWDKTYNEAYRRAEEKARRAAGARGYQRQQRGQRRPGGFDEAVNDNRERVDEYERTGEWQAGWWEKWRPGGYGYHERHDKYAHNTPPPPQEPQYTQEQIDRAYGRIPRISYDRPQPLDPVDLANDLRFALLMAAVALFFVSIVMLAVGSWTLEYVVADPLAALGDVGSFIGFAWHRRDIVLQFCGVAAWILALRQISDGLRAAPGFLAWAAVGTLLFVGGHLIGPPL